jgi:hypothetical protein
MTREQFDARLDELLEVDDIKAELKKLIAGVLSQGAVNLGEYEDNFALPKVMLHCALERYAWQFKPLDWNKDLQKEVKNIKHSI